MITINQAEQAGFRRPILRSGQPGGTDQSPTDGERMTAPSESGLTFAVAGIFGAGRLATRLNELESVNLIGPWHIGHWIDCTHTAIRIRFSSPADARSALINVAFASVLPHDAPK